MVRPAGPVRSGCCAHRDPLSSPSTFGSGHARRHSQRAQRERPPFGRAAARGARLVVPAAERLVVARDARLAVLADTVARPRPGAARRAGSASAETVPSASRAWAAASLATGTRNGEQLT